MPFYSYFVLPSSASRSSEKVWIAYTHNPFARPPAWAGRIVEVDGRSVVHGRKRKEGSIDRAPVSRRARINGVHRRLWPGGHRFVVEVARLATARAIGEAWHGSWLLESASPCTKRSRPAATGRGRPLVWIRAREGGREKPTSRQGRRYSSARWSCMRACAALGRLNVRRRCSIGGSISSASF